MWGSLGAWELGVWEGRREGGMARRHRLGKPPKELGNFTQGTRRTVDIWTRRPNPNIESTRRDLGGANRSPASCNWHRQFICKPAVITVNGFPQLSSTPTVLRRCNKYQLIRLDIEDPDVDSVDDSPLPPLITHSST